MRIRGEGPGPFLVDTAVGTAACCLGIAQSIVGETVGTHALRVRTQQGRERAPPEGRRRTTVPDELRFSEACARSEDRFWPLLLWQSFVDNEDIIRDLKGGHTVAHSHKVVQNLHHTSCMQKLFFRKYGYREHSNGVGSLPAGHGVVLTFVTPQHVALGLLNHDI